MPAIRRRSPRLTTAARASSCSEIGADQFVRTFAATRINLGRGRIDQVSVRIKGTEQADLVEAGAGLNLLQRILSHEKRSFHGAIVPPKSHSMPRCIV